MRQIKYLMIISTCIILVFTAITCGGTGTTTETNDSTTGNGDVVSGDVWEIKVVSVRTETRLEGEHGGKACSWTSEEGYSFLVVKVLIKNISVEKEWVRLSDISITDSEGQVYVAEGYGGERLDIVQGYGEDYYHMPTAWMTAVSPAGELSIKFVFTVPNDAVGFHLHFYDLPAIYLEQ